MRNQRLRNIVAAQSTTTRTCNLQENCEIDPVYCLCSCCRLPDRYPGQLKVAISPEEEEEVGQDEEEENIIGANSKVFNHNMNLETALIINTLSKVYSTVDVLLFLACS